MGGDINKKHTVHSIRKALLNSLYGIYADRGVIDTSATLGKLGISDTGGLRETEKSARVADLLKSRSGVYHSAAAETPVMTTQKQARHSSAPGEQFYYNN
ncbi:MAG: hypothetical protein U5K69_27475 [Balneolaceae bacterium]|nr:hypothetical protein [Balneolaceae bacterium]